MGVAAYWRGSRAISRGIAADYGLPDPYPEHRPTPRPATWGDKARARAEDHARRCLRGAARYGLDLDPDTLARAVADRARVSLDTARAAVARAMEERCS